MAKLKWNSARKKAFKDTLLKNGVYQCKMCKKTFSNHSDLNIDHVKPVAKGGKNNVGNLNLLCKSCNSKKGSKEKMEHLENILKNIVEDYNKVNFDLVRYEFENNTISEEELDFFISTFITKVDEIKWNLEFNLKQLEKGALNDRKN